MARKHLELATLTRGFAQGLAVVLFVGALSAIAGWLGPAWMPVGGLAATLVVLLAAGRHWKDLLWHKLEKQSLALAEVRALVGLQDPHFSTPLPWSECGLPPSALREVLRTIDLKDANVIAECGSGISTLYIAQTLRARGRGRLIALEHDKEWTLFMERQLRRFDLREWAEILLFPLEEREFYGIRSIWYSTPEPPLAVGEEVDLLLVDGPPGAPGQLSRLGAVPFFWPRLAEDSVVFLDDSRRCDESRIVEIWRREHPLEASVVATEHMMTVLSRRKAPHRA